MMVNEAVESGRGRALAYYSWQMEHDRNRGWRTGSAGHHQETLVVRASFKATFSPVTTAPADDPRFMLRAALMGFGRAYERFMSEATAGAAPESVFVPLSEALWWIVTTDDGFANLARVQSGYRVDPSYSVARDHDQSGCVLPGLRYARNRCGHQRALIAVERGVSIPFTVPFTLGFFFRWRASGELPPADPKFRDDRGRKIYDTLLADRPASQALDLAAKWFTHERNIAGL
jgi:hypothetical protein